MRKNDAFLAKDSEYELLELVEEILFDEQIEENLSDAKLETLASDYSRWA
jgi:hypothetical protein